MRAQILIARQLTGHAVEVVAGIVSSLPETPMAVPLDPTHPRHLTPEQRLDELTRLLATGTRRLLSLRTAPATPGAGQIPVESSQNGLEVCPEPRLHVPHG